MSKKQITAIVELDQSKYKTKIFADGHFIYADEPEELGGTNEGMPPGALLLASLGSCTAITISMYANRKQIPLEGIRIDLAICPEDEMKEGTVITRKIEFNGNIDDEQRKRLMLIADKCPIHKILSNPIQIISS
ncbi:OsmC family protein [Pedobacter sp. ASV28]|uniref:OsmC family protein n=1 Tax=Pedobacter sp. ASV28 TaxID=2795123 RepID=UPI0018EC0A57|nr:OsmC family protein [Pedobacter sp. ASV28]